MSSPPLHLLHNRLLAAGHHLTDMLANQPRTSLLWNPINTAQPLSLQVSLQALMVKSPLKSFPSLPGYPLPCFLHTPTLLLDFAGDLFLVLWIALEGCFQSHSSNGYPCSLSWKCRMIPGSLSILGYAQRLALLEVSGYRCLLLYSYVPWVSTKLTIVQHPLLPCPMPLPWTGSPVPDPVKPGCHLSLSESSLHCGPPRFSFSDVCPSFPQTWAFLFMSFLTLSCYHRFMGWLEHHPCNASAFRLAHLNTLTVVQPVDITTKVHVHFGAPSHCRARCTDLSVPIKAFLDSQALHSGVSSFALHPKFMKTLSIPS